MSQNRSILELHQVSTHHSSVVEFANIIATLQNSESSNQSQSPTPGFSPLPSVLTTYYNAFFPQVYTDDVRKQIATRVIFRTRLRDKALLWYQDLTAEIRGNWKSHEGESLTLFALVPRKEVDQTRFLNQVFNLRQHRAIYKGRGPTQRRVS